MTTDTIPLCEDWVSKKSNHPEPPKRQGGMERERRGEL